MSKSRVAPKRRTTANHPKPEAPKPISLADLRVTLIEPVTGKRFGVWTGARLLNAVRVAHEVLDELRQYELKIKPDDSERDFLLSSFLNRHCMLPLLEAGMSWDSLVGPHTMNVRAEIVPAGVAP